ncbi:MAG: ABC transporter permease, partial [Candidatus Geothermarchaeales archaeon]
FLAYVSARSAGVTRGLAEIPSSLPVAYPTMVIAVGLLWAVLSLPIGLYGTIWVLILAYSIAFIPHSLRFISGPMLQIHRDLEEVSRISGASLLQTLRKIHVRLLRPELLAAGIYVFMLTFKDLGVAVMLVTYRNPVFSALLYSVWNVGEQTIAAAISVIFVLALGGVLLVVRLVFGSVPLTPRMDVKAKRA